MLSSTTAIVEHARSGLGGVDLHTHSRHSDGHWNPAELVEDARRAGISVLALTDHDTVAGVVDAQEAGARLGIAVVSGAEMSLRANGRLFHVLCYDFDPTSSVWQEVEGLRNACRRRYWQQVFAQARERGHAVREEDAVDEHGNFVPDALAVALHAIGAAPSRESARPLARSLVTRNPIELLYADAVEFGALLPQDFAVCVVAHPARQEYGVSHRLGEDDLAALREALPLVGLEAHHPYHPAHDVTHYAETAQRHGLLVTCGSDAHGFQVNRPPRAHDPAICRDFLGLLLDRQAARAHAR